MGGGQVNPYCVATGGSFQGVAGTSASCPVVAGVFALLNGLRTSKKQSPLGFLNPFIYQNGAAFQDVASGVNGAGRKYGFKAVKGWDGGHVKGGYSCGVRGVYVEGGYCCGLNSSSWNLRVTGIWPVNCQFHKNVGFLAL